MNHPSTDQAMPADRRFGPARALSRGVVCTLGALALVVAVFAVYYPAARGPFVFDDVGTLVDNQSIRQLWPLVGSGENGGPLNAGGATAVHGRPLVNLSFAANYYLGELDPFGYRMVNLIIHLASAMLLWAIVARTLRLDHFRGRFDRVAEPLAFAAALVWALHPVNTESVVYVTQRTELMMGTFYLATLYCSIRYWATEQKAARAAFLILATLTCQAGMLSKEMMASAPAMVLLYERTFVAGSFRRVLSRSWPLYVGLMLTWVPLLALNLNEPRTPAAGFGLGVAAHEWWFTQSKVIFLYLKLAVWPWPLVIHYEIPYLTTVAQAWPWLLLTGLLVTGTVVLLWRRWAVGYVAIWFFAVLSPTLVIPLISETVAERRMYVPLVAIVPLLIVGGYAVFQLVWQSVSRRGGRKSSGLVPTAVFSVVTVVLAIGFGYLSSLRLLAYREELTLWQDAVLHQPHDPMVQFNLGTLLAEAGQVPEAVVHLEEAVRLDPTSSQAHFNLARAHESSARPREAIAHYRAALKLKSDDGASHYNLARLLEGDGDKLQAIEHYRQAIAAQPDFAAAHSNLGILLLTSGHTREAIESLEAALTGQEDTANCINLAMAYSMANRVSEAIRMAEKALDLARTTDDASMAKDALAYVRTRR